MIKLFGYGRVSRDEDKQNYSTIVSQRKMIQDYATETFKEKVNIKFYEDDGISGYTFDRVGFNEMVTDITSEVKNKNSVILIVKDLSRIGRHNAMTLLFLEDMKKIGVRIILITDNYDSLYDNDDTIGIKTWYNERYVKDISVKIKSNVKSRMKEGKYLSVVPYGYKRSEHDKEKIVIVHDEAEVVRRIFKMYLNGEGYRKIAIVLTKENIPTPSMKLKQRKNEKGEVYKKKVAKMWVTKMIMRILNNDFYVGVLRQGKYGLANINGKVVDKDESEQYIFENNHEAIVSREDFMLAQEIKKKRRANSYRGSGKYNINLYSGFLICSVCNYNMVALNKEGRNKSYICSSYNRTGKASGCSTHYILDKVLTIAIRHHLSLIREKLIDVIVTFDSKVKDKIKTPDNFDMSIKKLNNDLRVKREELKILYGQRIKEIAKSPDMEEFIVQTYSEIEQEKKQEITILTQQIESMNELKSNSEMFESSAKTALQIFDDIISKEKMERKDLELLIEKIIVDESGNPTIYLKDNIERILSGGGNKKANHSYRAGNTTKKFTSELGTLSSHKQGDYTPQCTNDEIFLVISNMARKFSLVEKKKNPLS